MCELIVWVQGMHWPKTGSTPVIKGLVIYNNRDLERLDMLNIMALGCYYPSYDILFVSTVLYLYPWAIRHCRILISLSYKTRIKILEVLRTMILHLTFFIIFISTFFSIPYTFRYMIRYLCSGRANNIIKDPGQNIIKSYVMLEICQLKLLSNFLTL